MPILLDRCYLLQTRARCLHHYYPQPGSRDDVEVPQVALGDIVPAPSRRPHSSNILQALQLPECQLLAIVPGRMVNGLAQQLYGRLCTILLNLQHHVQHTHTVNV